MKTKKLKKRIERKEKPKKERSEKNAKLSGRKKRADVSESFTTETVTATPSQEHSALKVISAAVTGTTAMTSFSYVVSASNNKQFREPELLAKLLRRLIPLGSPASNIAGWAMHYSVGFGFNIIYNFLWKKTGLKPGLLSGVILGGVSGLVGAGVWRTVFKFHPIPPSVDRNNYYKHLLLAHLVFGIFSAMGHRMVSDRKA